MTNCLAPSCKWRPPGECVYYSGDNISGLGITNGDNLNKVINLISSYVLSAAFATKATIGLGNVPNVDTTNASNITTGVLDIQRLSDEVSKTIVLEEDIENDTTSLIDVFSFPVEEAGSYYFKFYIHFNSGDGATTSDWSITTPALSTMTFETIINGQYAGGMAADDEVGGLNVVSELSRNTAVIQGIVQAGADGEVTARMVSGTDGNIIVALSDFSLVEYRKIA